MKFYRTENPWPQKKKYFKMIVIVSFLLARLRTYNIALQTRVVLRKKNNQTRLFVSMSAGKRNNGVEIFIERVE